MAANVLEIDTAGLTPFEDTSWKMSGGEVHCTEFFHISDCILPVALLVIYTELIADVRKMT